MRLNLARLLSASVASVILSSASAGANPAAEKAFDEAKSLDLFVFLLEPSERRAIRAFRDHGTGTPEEISGILEHRLGEVRDLLGNSCHQEGQPAKCELRIALSFARRFWIASGSEQIVLAGDEGEERKAVWDGYRKRVAEASAQEARATSGAAR